MTTWSDIICNYAMQQIDDDRLNEQLSVNPALFLRRMSLYVEQALSLMSSPFELLELLENSMVKATYDSFTWISTYAGGAVSTGKIGYELCSVTIRTEDGIGSIPYDGASYNSATGVVTFPAQENAGIDYEIDFYKDGTFHDMSVSMKRLYGLAIAVLWDERFTRNWLNITPKIKDGSFETINESNYMDKIQQRLSMNRQSFNDELRKYEQNCAFKNRDYSGEIKSLV